MCEFACDWQGRLRVWTDKEFWPCLTLLCSLALSLLSRHKHSKSYWNGMIIVDIKIFLIDIVWLLKYHRGLKNLYTMVQVKSRTFVTCCLLSFFYKTFEYFLKWPRRCGWIKILPAFRLVQMALEGIRGRAIWELGSTPTFKNDSLEPKMVQEQEGNWSQHQLSKVII